MTVIPRGSLRCCNQRGHRIHIHRHLTRTELSSSYKAAHTSATVPLHTAELSAARRSRSKGSRCRCTAVPEDAVHHGGRHVSAKPKYASITTERYRRRNNPLETPDAASKPRLSSSAFKRIMDSLHHEQSPAAWAQILLTHISTMDSDSITQALYKIARMIQAQQARSSRYSGTGGSAHAQKHHEQGGNAQHPVPPVSDQHSSHVVLQNPALRPLLQALHTIVLEHHTRFRSSAVCSTVYLFAVIGHLPPELISSILKQVETTLPHFRPVTHSLTLWSFAKLGVTVPFRLLSQWEVYVADRLPQFALRDIAMVTWAFARLRYDPGIGWMHEVCKHMCSLVRSAYGSSQPRIQADAATGGVLLTAEATMSETRVQESQIHRCFSFDNAANPVDSDAVQQGVCVDERLGDLQAAGAGVSMRGKWSSGNGVNGADAALVADASGSVSTGPAVGECGSTVEGARTAIDERRDWEKKQHFGCENPCTNSYIPEQSGSEERRKTEIAGAQSLASGTELHSRMTVLNSSKHKWHELGAVATNGTSASRIETPGMKADFKTWCGDYSKPFATSGISAAGHWSDQGPEWSRQPSSRTTAQSDDWIAARWAEPEPGRGACSPPSAATLCADTPLSSSDPASAGRRTEDEWNNGSQTCSACPRNGRCRQEACGCNVCGTTDSTLYALSSHLVDSSPILPTPSEQFPNLFTPPNRAAEEAVSSCSVSTSTACSAAVNSSGSGGTVSNSTAQNTARNMAAFNCPTPTFTPHNIATNSTANHCTASTYTSNNVADKEAVDTSFTSTFTHPSATSLPPPFFSDTLGLSAGSAASTSHTRSHADVAPVAPVPDQMHEAPRGQTHCPLQPLAMYLWSHTVFKHPVSDELWSLLFDSSLSHLPSSCPSSLAILAYAITELRPRLSPPPCAWSIHFLTAVQSKLGSMSLHGKCSVLLFIMRFQSLQECLQMEKHCGWSPSVQESGTSDDSGSKSTAPAHHNVFVSQNTAYSGRPLGRTDSRRPGLASHYVPATVSMHLNGFMSDVAHHSLSQLPAAGAQDLAILISGFGTVGLRPPRAWVEEYVCAVWRQKKEMTVQGAVAALAAGAKLFLAFPPSMVHQMVQQVLKAGVHTLPPMQLHHFAWAMSRLRLTPSATLLAQLLHAFQANFPKYYPSGLACIITVVASWVCQQSHAGHHSPASRETRVGRFQYGNGGAGTMEPRSNCIVSDGSVGEDHEVEVAAVGVDVAGRLGSSPDHVSAGRVHRGLSCADVDEHRDVCSAVNGRWMESFLYHVLQGLSYASVQDLVAIVQGLCVLEARPSREWVDAVLQACLIEADQLSQDDQHRLVAAVAELRRDSCQNRVPVSYDNKQQQGRHDTTVAWTAQPGMQSNVSELLPPNVTYAADCGIVGFRCSQTPYIMTDAGHRGSVESVQAHTPVSDLHYVVSSCSDGEPSAAVEVVKGRAQLTDTNAREQWNTVLSSVSEATNFDAPAKPAQSRAIKDHVHVEEPIKTASPLQLATVVLGG